MVADDSNDDVAGAVPHEGRGEHQCLPVGRGVAHVATPNLLEAAAVGREAGAEIVITGIGQVDFTVGEVSATIGIGRLKLQSLDGADTFQAVGGDNHLAVAVVIEAVAGDVAIDSVAGVGVLYRHRADTFATVHRVVDAEHEELDAVAAIDCILNVGIETVAGKGVAVPYIVVGCGGLDGVVVLGMDGQHEGAGYHAAIFIIDGIAIDTTFGEGIAVKIVNTASLVLVGLLGNTVAGGADRDRRQRAHIVGRADNLHTEGVFRVGGEVIDGVAISVDKSVYHFTIHIYIIESIASAVTPIEGSAVGGASDCQAIDGQTAGASVVQCEEVTCNGAGIGTGVDSSAATVIDNEGDFTIIGACIPDEIDRIVATDGECSGGFGIVDGKRADDVSCLHHIDGASIPTVTVAVATDDGDVAIVASAVDEGSVAATVFQSGEGVAGPDRGVAVTAISCNGNRITGHGHKTRHCEAGSASPIDLPVALRIHIPNRLISQALPSDGSFVSSGGGSEIGNGQAASALQNKDIINVQVVVATTLGRLGIEGHTDSLTSILCKADILGQVGGAGDGGQVDV